MVNNLDKQTIVRKFDSHWVPYAFSFVHNLVNNYTKEVGHPM